MTEMYRLLIDGQPIGTDEDIVKPLIERLTYCLQADGFGVVTIINLDAKAEEV